MTGGPKRKTSALMSAVPAFLPAVYVCHLLRSQLDSALEANQPGTWRPSLQTRFDSKHWFSRCGPEPVTCENHTHGSFPDRVTISENVLAEAVQEIHIHARLRASAGKEETRVGEPCGNRMSLNKRGGHRTTPVPLLLGWEQLEQDHSPQRRGQVQGAGPGL